MSTLHLKLQDPHAFLGLHLIDEEHKVVRLWRPGATSIHFTLFGKIVTAEKIDDRGLFQYEVPFHTEVKDYRVFHLSGLLAADPYAFFPSFGELDGHLFSKGVHYQLYQVMGARVATLEGHDGVKFIVWAPNAEAVALVADFNHWDGSVNPMRSLGGSGVWELFVPGLEEGEKYKFEIRTKEGALLVKADPFATYSEMRPKTASIVFDVDRYKWHDEAWMAKRGSCQAPIIIYEVHLGSWKTHEGTFLNYRTLAHELTVYCQKMGFTHVELMPVMEHPLDESWGYQVTGFYAATSRFGTAEDFQYFVDFLHQAGIGVILDWVPAHFPTDAFSLIQFDGTPLFEHEDPRKGFHPHWNTLIFNYGRYEVSNFLLASALYWLDKMHIDGLRVDAVASMLYLDYGRNEGEWLPNLYGGRENLEAIEFLKHLNAAVHQRFPSVLMFAEESTSFPGITQSVNQGGLGFDLKWNMGWMNDTLRFFKKDPFFRHFHHSDLTFGLLYAFTERFISVLSHDEVVHGKASLLSKMPGDDWQKFANVRLLYSYMICQPGKKLLFMGAEIGQWSEWNCKRELDWYLLDYFPHHALQQFVLEMNRFYLSHRALWENDFDYRGFEWVDLSDRQNSVISYLRKGAHSALLCVHHFTPTYFSDYFIALPSLVHIVELFNTDREEYGGSGKINAQIKYDKHGLTIQLAPLATLIFEVHFGS